MERGECKAGKRSSAVSMSCSYVQTRRYLSYISNRQKIYKEEGSEQLTRETPKHGLKKVELSTVKDDAGAAEGVWPGLCMVNCDRS